MMALIWDAQWRLVRRNAALGFEVRRAQASEALLARTLGIAGLHPSARIDKDRDWGVSTTTQIRRLSHG